MPHDIIKFFPKTKDRIFDVCAPLYKAGCSLREIEEKTGFAKSSIREALNRRGLPLRNASKAKASNTKQPVRVRSPILPYGFAWLEGKLVKDPREYKTVLKVIGLWQAGKSFSAIACALNDQRVPTRNGKKWFHSSIGAIVKRHQEENQQTEGGPSGTQ